MSNKVKKNIMVIDDEKEIFEVVKAILSPKYNLIYNDGYNALKKISLFSPDLILLDIKISNIDGCTIAKSLKRRKNTRKIPILFMTADNEIQSKSEACDVDGYIKKPFDIEDLERLVKHYTTD